MKGVMIEHHALIYILRVQYFQIISFLE